MKIGIVGTGEIGIGDKIEKYSDDKFSNRLVDELMSFVSIYKYKDYKRCYELLAHSLIVVETAVLARKAAGIVFGADFILNNKG